MSWWYYLKTKQKIITLLWSSHNEWRALSIITVKQQQTELPLSQSRARRDSLLCYNSANFNIKIRVVNAVLLRKLIIFPNWFLIHLELTVVTISLFQWLFEQPRLCLLNNDWLICLVISYDVILLLLFIPTYSFLISTSLPKVPILVLLTIQTPPKRLAGHIIRDRGKSNNWFARLNTFFL